MSRPGGLGRGLSSLIPAGEIDEAGLYREIPIAHISANPSQPRNHFDEEAIESLAASIREVGVLQPVLVRAAGDDKYELIAGERRWRAARRAGLSVLPAMVRTADDVTSLAAAVVENIHREDLHALEEAAAYQQLLEDFGLTHDELAKRLGKSRAAISNTLRLLHLPPRVQRLVADGQLTAGHARALLGSPDRGFQERLANRIVGESLSVRATENEVRSQTTGTNGGSAGQRRSRQPSKARPAALLELEELLSEHLSTRVTVSMQKAKGTIAIDFAGLEDLERLYHLMASG